MVEQAPRREIINKDTIKISFDYSGPGQDAENLSILGETTGGQLTIFLADGNKKLAKKRLARLRTDNPGVNFEVCQGPSIFAIEPGEELMAAGKFAAKFLIKAKDIQEGQNHIKLGDIAPIGNLGWKGIWALTDRRLKDLKIS